MAIVQNHAWGFLNLMIHISNHSLTKQFYINYILQWIIMGEVAIKYRLMPESPEVDTDAIISKIPSLLPDDAKLGASEIKPFAFGLQAIFILVRGPDRGGLPDELEGALGNIDGIQSVELEEMSLI